MGQDQGVVGWTYQAGLSRAEIQGRWAGPALLKGLDLSERGKTETRRAGWERAVQIPAMETASWRDVTYLGGVFLEEGLGSDQS